ncbi:MAG: hypothetical protein ABIR60_05815 [Allosphingosinicella sp.]
MKLVVGEFVEPNFPVVPGLEWQRVRHERYRLEPEGHRSWIKEDPPVGNVVPVEARIQYVADTHKAL